jgi:putative transcriptional regulator
MSSKTKSAEKNGTVFRQKVLAGFSDAVAFAKGDHTRGRATVLTVPDVIDVKEIRERLKMTQGEFALRFGFSLGTLRQWEQRRRFPDGPARTLLTVIARKPKPVLKALEDAASEASRSKSAA